MRPVLAWLVALLILVEAPLLRAAQERPTQHPPEVDLGPAVPLEKPQPPSPRRAVGRTSPWVWILGAVLIGGVAVAAGTSQGDGGGGGSSATGTLVITGSPP